MQPGTRSPPCRGKGTDGRRERPTRRDPRSAFAVPISRHAEIVHEPVALAGRGGSVRCRPHWRHWRDAGATSKRERQEPGRSLRPGSVLRSRIDDASRGLLGERQPAGLLEKSYSAAARSGLVSIQYRHHRMEQSRGRCLCAALWAQHSNLGRRNGNRSFFPDRRGTGTAFSYAAVRQTPSRIAHRFMVRSVRSRRRVADPRHDHGHRVYR